jgi:hypothetical protein
MRSEHEPKLRIKIQIYTVEQDAAIEHYSQDLLLSLRVTTRYNNQGYLVRAQAMSAACMTIQPARLIKAFSFLPH